MPRPLYMQIGFAGRWETRFNWGEMGGETGLQFGANVRFTDRIGLAVLFHFGFQFLSSDIFLPDPYCGGRTGPISYL